MFRIRISLQWLILATAFTIQLVAAAGKYFKPINVSYDHRALIIDGNRRMLISGEIRYPRSTPRMWPDLIAKSKEGGADVIQRYVFWNGHEPVKGQFNFEGRYDIVKFVRTVASNGLHLHLRIGPYVCAEWNFGLTTYVWPALWLQYFGGTNFGRTSGGPNYISSYDYDAPFDEYGLLSQPKWGRLKDLHAVIKLCELALVADSLRYIKLGPLQEVGAQTFIKSVEFNAPSPAKVPQQVMFQEKLPLISKYWVTVKEPIGEWSEEKFTAKGEHLNVTKDYSDYLWYITRIHVSDDDVSFWKENEVSPTLSIDSMRDLVHVFINGKLSGSAKVHWIKVVQPVQLMQGYNDIVLLSQTVGLQNYCAFYEKDGAGFKCQIKLTGFEEGDIDLKNSSWTNQVGLNGEFLKLYSMDKNESAGRTELALDEIPSFLWYKTYFDAPGGTDPVVLNLGSMGKGQAWVNGHHIGRYRTLVSPKDGCKSCDYRGAFNSDKCTTNCGEPTQIWYHIPRSWLERSKNLLVIFEETGGSPSI